MCAEGNGEGEGDVRVGLAALGLHGERAREDAAAERGPRDRADAVHLLPHTGQRCSTREEEGGGP